MTERLPDRIETIDHVRAWDAAAERFETPCGAGYLVWRKWGSGPTVIFCHGGSGSWTHWCRTIPVVSKTHTVYAVDLPGLGDSALPCDPSHPAGSAEALNQGIRRLIPREENPRIVAFSFGCHISTLALAGLGQVSEAESLWLSRVREDPGAAQAWHNLASLAIQRGDLIADGVEQAQRLLPPGHPLRVGAAVAEQSLKDDLRIVLHRQR